MRFSVLDSREQAIRGPTDNFLPRPVHGYESRTVHQIGRRLPLHISGVYGKYPRKPKRNIFLKNSHTSCCLVIIFDLFPVAGGELCTFPHLHSWPQEGLSEYSLGHHGECFYFWLKDSSPSKSRGGWGLCVCVWGVMHTIEGGPSSFSW